MKRLNKTTRFCLTVLAALFLSTGCENGGSDSSSHDFGDNDENTIVAMGDSITRGYGLAASESYPTQLSYLVGKTVINGGVDAARSEAGVSAVNSYLSSYSPGYLLILYGINDLIHGGDEDTIISNLRAIVVAAKDNSTVPILANLTPVYESYESLSDAVNSLNSRISSLGSEQGVSVANLNGTLGSTRSLMQDDGLHPNADGAALLASTFSGYVD